MFTRGLPRYKYVYPLILLLLLLFLLLRAFASGEDAPPVKDDAREEEEEVDFDWMYPDRTAIDRPHEEDDFIRAAETFNASAAFNDPSGKRRENRRPSFTSADKTDFPFWRARKAGSLADERFRREVGDLSFRRENRERDYHLERQDLENLMTSYDRDSREYDDLRQRLNRLNRDHFQSERAFEKDYRDAEIRYAKSGL